MKKDVIEKNPFHNKSVACFFAVFGLLLLLCGDILVSSFLPVQPNDNYSKEKELSIDEISYDISFLEKISFSDFVNKMEKKEDFFVLLISDFCSSCEEFSSVLKEVIDNYPISSIYYLNLDEVSKNTSLYETFFNYFNLSMNELESVPYFFFFQNGMNQKEWIGMNEEFQEELLYFFQNY